MPKISISHTEFKFEECYFYDQKIFDLIITNEGFISTNVDIVFTNQEVWIEINPKLKEKLAPGSNYKVEFKTDINYNNLKRLNKTSFCDDILIVSSLNGNELFHSISIDYKRTIIGFSLKSLSTLNKNQSFFDNNLINNIEDKVSNYESELDIKWKQTYAKILTNNQKLMVMSHFINDKTLKFTTNPIDINKECFKILKTALIEKDEYFKNDLSSEYLFLMQHLINRCNQNTFTQTDSNENLETLKNNILIYLSTKMFEKIEKSNFPVEILIEVLKDLICSFSNSLIPSRYIDYIQYIENNYEELLNLLDHIPVANRKLFELIIKLLQVHSKKLDYVYIFANAIFKIDMTKNDDFIKRKSAWNFLDIFIKKQI
jgi:hypothetical protein